jgi:hypothetical protein
VEGSEAAFLVPPVERVPDEVVSVVGVEIEASDSQSESLHELTGWWSS